MKLLHLIAHLNYILFIGMLILLILMFTPVMVGIVFPGWVIYNFLFVAGLGIVNSIIRSLRLGSIRQRDIVLGIVSLINLISLIFLLN